MLEILVQQTLEQHRERLRQAERQIAINEAMAEHGGESQIYDRAVGRVGGWLVAWGRQMQSTSHRRRGHYI